MFYKNIREEELKNKVAEDYFPSFDCTKIIGNIDFCVSERKLQQSLLEEQSLLWAEAKQGNKNDIYKSFVQLILTIGKARTFGKYLPPVFLSAFDAEKIAFIPYNEVQYIFSQNDFNWNVTPSNHETKEFQQIYEKVKTVIENNSLLFFFGQDDDELLDFIKINFIVGKSSISKIQIDKNNFVAVYNKWLISVKPSIAVKWEEAQKAGIIDGDFYLADLLSSENQTLKEKLYVLLKKNIYELDRTLNDLGMFNIIYTGFKDGQKAHTQFWNRYERPPEKQYWDYIIERRDLLVPQDVRERKGSFFTPQIWVDLSRKYLADVLGENWQEEYYIWDCAAGTGNLLAGLTNKYNVWASTLDRQDVDVMKARFKSEVANNGESNVDLLENHVFQFDFLNDDFAKLPKSLQDIINNPKTRKKLLIYINPPYAEADNRKGQGRIGVAESAIKEKYGDKMGYSKREMYVQFLTRIYCEMNGSWIADFSKLKNMQAPKFSDFRAFFKAKLEKCFLMPANSFDNVTGDFPIGLKIWNTGKKENFESIVADVYNASGVCIGQKMLCNYDRLKLINDWIKPYRNTPSESIATIIGVASDFQNQRLVRIEKAYMEVPADNHHWQITKDNLIESAVYYAVRKVIKASWLNDRDQFLFPNEEWKVDSEFQNDCFTYTLFNTNIKAEEGVNHWIPFREQEVDSKEKFESNFMWNFIQGKLKVEKSADLLVEKTTASIRTTPLVFSLDAKTVFNAGLALWKYYHAQENANENASLYDIRAHFQGRNEKGRMNSSSEDETYNKLIGDLREKLNILAQKIEPKVYEYGFLKR